MVRYLSIDEILRLHFQVVEDYGGSHGVRDEGRLASAAEAPRQSIFGGEQYPSLYEKAAVYARNIIADHPFSDGNKRTGITVAAVFLLRNGVRLTASPGQLEDFAVSIATDHLTVEVIADWLEAHSTTIQPK
ncbi:type II toxin-antitoxin system death-on-curing family toxin [Candidatus Saccharibacteria bacterium]|nr:type II toxin-antitoxin system death-on-curing family toxin [Candidatus Saccharibacteria bacterium]